MTEIEFCEYWGESLEDIQRQMAEHHIRKGTFLGVGREIGRMCFWPLVEVGRRLNVIDGAGHYQLAAIDGQRLYSSRQIVFKIGVDDELC